jgi:putative transposase
VDRSELRLCAIVIDGTPFKDRQMIVALGIGCDGRKTVLGLREGATENTAVVSSLLSELVERGVDFSTLRLYILDGGKALAAAVRKHAGEAAFIQRCQVHKKRNVVDHLPEEHKADVKRKLQNAYAMVDYAEAKRALEKLHRELTDLNPSAARSLEEGMEETLTVHKLRVPDQLRRTLCCTNVIESAFSIVETVCRNANAGGQAIRSSAGLARGYWSPSSSSGRSLVIARFPYCCLRWPMLFLRNRSRKEPPLCNV